MTFSFRRTHALPAFVPPPPASWRGPYEALAREDQLAWTSLDAVFEASRAFLDPVLAGELDATWDVASWRWHSR